MAAQGRIRIGISGWRYAPWRGVFYPAGLPQRRELEFASRMLPTIEINGSFYSLQRPEFYAEWHDATPDGLRLRGEGPALHHPHAAAEGRRARRSPTSSPRACSRCGAKLGPVLWQFAAAAAASTPERFEAFFELLPRDTEAAAALAARHDHRARTAARGSRSTRSGRCATRSRSAIRASSIRPSSPCCAGTRIALVVADTAGKWPLLEDLTADFVYVRLHGDKELYASGYGDAALDRWAARIDAWGRGGQVERCAARLDARRAEAQPRATSTATSTTT